MKLITTALLICATILSLSFPVLGAEPSFESTVQKFVRIVAGGDRKAIANAVSYPLQRAVPLPRIDNPHQFLAAFDEILDEKILKAISTSRIPADWSEMGWRGIMFQDGALWLNEEGRVTAINCETEKGRRKRTELIEADKQKLPGSLRDFVEPVLEWETGKFRIRIDCISQDKFRYAAWPLNKTTSEQPALVLRNGSLTFEGSGGNHHYDFKSGPHNYRCTVNVIGAADDPPGELEVTKHDKVVLSQPVVRVIKGR